MPKHEGGYLVYLLCLYLVYLLCVYLVRLLCVYLVHLLCVYSSARKFGFVCWLLHCACCTQHYHCAQDVRPNIDILHFADVSLCRRAVSCKGGTDGTRLQDVL